MNPNEYALVLVQEALADLDGEKLPLSAIVRKCIRIARLRNDFLNLWWLEFELMSITNKTEILRIESEAALQLSQEQFQTVRKEYHNAWVNERESVRITDELEFEYKDNILAKGIGEIEVNLGHFAELAAEPPAPQGLHPLDLYFVEKERTQQRLIAGAMVHSCKGILERCRVRVHNFLSLAEKELVFGQFHSDLFEKNRQYVDIKLGKIAPEALEQITAAYNRSHEGSSEERAQALTSCRRLLKTLADSLFPPKDQEVIGTDGKSHKLTEDLYISRLWQYAYEQVGRTASGNLLTSQVQELGNRLDRLYDLTCKGVHDHVSEFEVNQCIMQTYLLVGDLLRISEQTSAIGMENQLPSKARD